MSPLKSRQGSEVWKTRQIPSRLRPANNVGHYTTPYRFLYFAVENWAMRIFMRRLLVGTSARGLILCTALLLSACAAVPNTERPADRPNEDRAPLSWKGLPVYDHIVIVVEENKDYRRIGNDLDFIVGSFEAPFINKLRAEGASLARMYAEEHFSQGNYYWLLSGSHQDVGFFDHVPSPGSINADNLASRLIARGRSFAGFSEGLPSIGWPEDGNDETHYARKHVPWIAFSNIPNGGTRDTSSNLRFEDFPSGETPAFDTLPTVSVVIPNLMHDMHDPDIEYGIGAIVRGDTWLKDNLGKYYEWAKTHNSLLIVTFDENDHGLFNIGLTSPAASDAEGQNQIATIFAGAGIKLGYEDPTPVTHVNLLRTIEAMYGLPRSGEQQERALEAGISDETVITHVFQTDASSP
jgi:hypothetical protein